MTDSTTAAQGAPSPDRRLRARVVALGTRGLGSVAQLGIAAVAGHLGGQQVLGGFYLFSGWTNLAGTGVSLGLPTHFLRRLSSDKGALPPFRLAARYMGGTALLLAILCGVLVCTEVVDDWVFFLALGPAAGAVALLRLNSESLKGLGRPSLALALEYVGPPALAGMLCLFAYALQGVLSTTHIVLSLTLAYMVACSAAGLATKRSLASEQSRATVGLDLRESSGQLGVALVNYSYAALPYILLPALVDTDTIASFGAAHRWVALAGTLNVALNAIFAPEFALSAAQFDARRLRQTYRNSVATTVLIYLPFALLLALARAPLLRLVGVADPLAQAILLILLTGRLTTVLFGLVESALVMSGHERQETLSGVLGLAVFCGGSLLTWTQWGVVGFAAFYAAAFTVRAALSLLFLRHFMNGN